MAKQVQLRGGTYAQSTAFTGAIREVTVDTTNNTLIVHDGATAGGHRIAKEIENDTPASAAATGTAGTIVWDTNYIYVCVATDTWKRASLSTWP